MNTTVAATPTCQIAASPMASAATSPTSREGQVRAGSRATQAAPSALPSQIGVIAIGSTAVSRLTHPSSR